MIYGIGVDTATVSRLQKSVQSDAFVQKVFSPQERALFVQRKEDPQVIAANFAAKEALSKALGTGLFQGFSMAEVQVLRKESKAPYFAFTGEMQALMHQQRLVAHLSLTHEGGFATAFVILEQMGE